MKKSRSANLQASISPEPVLIDAGSSGDWLSAEELKQEALEVSGEGKDVTLNLANFNHLDASALQILLALDLEQKKRGQHLRLVNVSQDLLRWFDYAGATSALSIIQRTGDE